jgi:hypothetical protein
MKILYVTRLFSGLEDSFSTKIWNPSGVPTIYRVIEEIDKHHTPCFLFIAKDNGQGYFSLWNESTDKEIVVSGLNHNVRIITGINFFPAWLGRRLNMILREIRQFIFVMLEIIKFKPDLVYCDHANVFIGGILSRIQSRIPVVFRVMGVDGFMRQCLTPDNFIQKAYRWAYKSPFDIVLCTQDGSGVELWMNSVLQHNVRREVLLNGIDVITLPRIIDKRLLDIPNEKTVILFIGKLEVYKGCYEFVQSVLLLLRGGYNNIHALIIGIGNEEQSLKNLIETKGANGYFTFINGLPHEQISVAHSISDIYVSMNHFGNLSNVNLEAIQSNDCIIIPKQQVDIDIVTNSLLKGGVVTVSIQDPEGLSNALMGLIDSKEKRAEMSYAISIIKKDFLWSWQERIDREMRLLQSVVSSNNSN